MWNTCESKTRPELLDQTSSKKYNYVRKDIHEVTRQGEGGEEVYYVYLEKKVLKEDWETYAQVMANTQDVADISDALIELAALIG